MHPEAVFLTDFTGESATENSPRISRTFNEVIEVIAQTNVLRLIPQSFLSAVGYTDCPAISVTVVENPSESVFRMPPLLNSSNVTINQTFAAQETIDSGENRRKIGKRDKGPDTS